MIKEADQIANKFRKSFINEGKSVLKEGMQIKDESSGNTFKVTIPKNSLGYKEFIKTGTSSAFTDDPEIFSQKYCKSSPEGITFEFSVRSSIAKKFISTVSMIERNGHGDVEDLCSELLSAIDRATAAPTVNDIKANRKSERPPYEPLNETIYTLSKSGELRSTNNTSLDEALDTLNSKSVLITTKDLKALYESKMMATVGEYEEEQDPQELHMVAGELDSICENVEFLKMQVMEGHDWPAWAFQHLNVACDNIEEVTTYFKAEKDPYMDQYEDEGMYTEEPNSYDNIGVVGEAKKKKPSAGLTKKQKSAVVKKAEKGEDIGKKGKGFEKLADKAAKEYGSEEAGKRVAASAMWKNIKRK